MANNNINRSLTGIDPLAYMGINASGSKSASQTVVQYRAPTMNDSKNFIIGCFWLWPDTDSPAHSAQIWMLTALIGNEATWTLLQDSGTGEIVTIDGDTGFITGPTVSITGLTTAGSTVSFDGDNATAMTFSVTDALVNTILGRNAGNATITGTSNTGLGLEAFSALTTGISNTAVGLHAGRFVTTGQNNTFLGRSAGSALTTSNNNTILGTFSAISLLTGANNIIIGRSAGNALVAAESDNIIIGSTGVVGDSAKIRIGTNGTQTACHIVGIDGVNVGNVAEVVTMSAAGDQLGTAVITAGSGVTVTPGANTITIAASTTSIDRINGDVSFVEGSTVSITGNTTAGSSVNFTGNGTTTMTLDVTDGSSNTLIGLQAGNGTLSGSGNTSVGRQSLTALTSGDENSAFGATAGEDLTSGDFNTLVGFSAGAGITTGSNNIALGHEAALNYTAAEANNIIIGNAGVLGDSAKIRIGTGGTQTATFIAGIDGVNVGSTATVVTEASNQLGTAVITAGSGISVTPGANTITIAATGPATASSMVGIGRSSLNTSAGVTWASLFDATVPSATQSEQQTVIPFNATIDKLYVNVDANANTSAGTITINKNSVNTTIVATITATTTGVFSDTTHSASFAAGDLIQIEYSQSTVGNSSGSISFRVTPT